MLCVCIIIDKEFLERQTTDTGNGMQLLDVTIPDEFTKRISTQTLHALRGVLACDPRPRYQHDPERIYGMKFGGHEVKFQVINNNLIVKSID